MATSFSGGRSRSTRREPPTMGKQLVNFITSGCESSALFFVIYKPTSYWWLACMSCWVIQLPSSLNHPNPLKIRNKLGKNFLPRWCISGTIIIITCACLFKMSIALYIPYDITFFFSFQEQYEFCYRCIQEYLSTESLYANV